MRKAFVILMIAMMLMCFMPSAAFADTEHEARIGENLYDTLDEAITAAADGDKIEVLKDCSTEGLNLSKSIIIEGEGHKIDFYKYGIALWGKSLTFENCTVEMKGVGSTPYTAEWNWMSICANKDAVLTLNNTDMIMDGTGAGNAHAIYFCSNNKLNLNNSTLTIKNYAQDALEWDGGDGGYNINIVNSKYISDHNRSGFTGTFYATIANSKVDVINSTGNGSNGSHFIITDSEVNFNDNGAHGLSARMLTIDNSSVNAIGNGANGIHAASKMEIRNNSNVSVCNNGCSISSQWTLPGALHVGGADSFIDETCKVEITDNEGSGILVKANASLDMKAGIIIRNTAEKLGMGGGINNSGIVTLSDDVQLYNNHAAIAGDDIYNTEVASITFGKVGSGWKLDGEPDCTDDITGWFDDSENSRWNAHGEEPLHMEEFIPTSNGIAEEKSLKAAHGKISPVIPPYIPPVTHYYTVIYNDGVEGEVVFPDQINRGLTYWTLTPDFNGVPVRDGYEFRGWTPVVAERVTEDAYYQAVWEKTEEPVQPTDPVKPINPDEPQSPEQPTKPDRPDTEVPKTGDAASLDMLINTFALTLSVLGGTLLWNRYRRKEEK